MTATSAAARSAPCCQRTKTRRGAANRYRALATLLVSILALGPGCRGSSPGEAPSPRTPESAGANRVLTVTSPAFSERSLIPPKHTCDGADASPALAWTEPPEGTGSFAIICDDPDAPMGTWVHWVLYDLPPEARGISEGVPALEVLPDSSRQGINDFRKLGYGGPCPPPGRPHGYEFKLYALDTRLGLADAPTRSDLERAMQGHVLAEGRLIGLYGR